ncbi:hypothetical protein [Caballeronia choica]|uniref:hypothetical protein n=1 Tax=Caballeronia choica TaxID=326476 RepID=UPI000A74D0AA|nr:hypothetical protein [Caballeronia choica]
MTNALDRMDNPLVSAYNFVKASDEVFRWLIDVDVRVDAVAAQHPLDFQAAGDPLRNRSVA